MAAGRAGNLEDGFEPIQTSFGAVQAAEATGNQEMIAAANAHYGATLARIAEESGLEPVVQALEEELFTSELDEAL
jgi:H2-forming N5,N10-methylenetetrahydromethanopterin dehydrogenase-like enzyme